MGYITVTGNPTNLLGLTEKELATTLASYERVVM